MAVLIVDDIRFDIEFIIHLISRFMPCLATALS